MAHPNYGLKLPEVYISGRYARVCVEPTTHQCTCREIRVAAYQGAVLNYLGIKHPEVTLTSSFKYLPDSTFVPLANGQIAWGENSDRRLTSSQIYESQGQWCENELARIQPEYTIDRFMFEWRRRVKLLRARKVSTVQV